MRKLICLLLLPILSLLCLTGCGDDRTSADIKKLYESMITVNVVDKENKFFADGENPHTIKIAYPENVQDAINNEELTTDILKRYKAISYQQLILDYIFNYYENNNEDFYNVMSSAKFPNTEMNALYDSLSNLKSSLDNFKGTYNTFIDATEIAGPTDIMEFNLMTYSYELNKIIDASFNFIYKFVSMYQNYGIEKYSSINTKNLSIRIDKSYIDVAYIAYLENIKAFDYSVGSKGICDLAPVINDELMSERFYLLDNLQPLKSLSLTVQGNLNPEDVQYDEVNNIINNYLYSQEVFDQRLTTYKTIYNEEDIYNITQYKFGLVHGVTYDRYLSLLNNSDKASVEMMDNFISNTYSKLIEKMNLMLE